MAGASGYDDDVAGDAALAFPWWKRSIDLLACVLLMPVLVTAYFAMAVLVRLHSPGPVLFRQKRVGQFGRSFTILKFRTMAVGADATPHARHLAELLKSKRPMLKLDLAGDSRLVRGALFLRASGIDELPQILNVLRGEMSLIGPRPCLPSEYAYFPAEARERFKARPGLTGLWQVSGKNRTTFEEMVRLDTDYIRNPSFLTDLKIIALTVPTLLQQIAESRAARKRASQLNDERLAAATSAVVSETTS